VRLVIVGRASHLGERPLREAVRIEGEGAAQQEVRPLLVTIQRDLEDRLDDDGAAGAQRFVARAREPLGQIRERPMASRILG